MHHRFFRSVEEAVKSIGGKAKSLGDQRDELKAQCGSFFVVGRQGLTEPRKIGIRWPLEPMSVKSQGIKDSKNVLVHDPIVACSLVVQVCVDPSMESQNRTIRLVNMRHM